MEEYDKEKKKQGGEFSQVFNTGSLVTSGTILKFLTPKEIAPLATSNSEVRDTTSLVWKIKIMQTFGPNPEVLKNPGENYAQAYRRQIIFTQQLIQQPVNSQQDMINRLVAYPNYYSYRIVTSADFKHVLFNLDTFYNFIVDYPDYVTPIIEILLHNRDYAMHLFRMPIDLLQFTQKFPDARSRIIDLVLESPETVTRLLRDPEDLACFLQNFMDYAELALQEVVKNTEHFTRLFREPADFKQFTHAFPSYTAQVIKVILNNSTHFTRLINYPVELLDFIRHYSNYTQDILTIILADSRHFIRLFPRLNNLYQFTQAHPSCTARVIEWLLENKKYLPRLIPDLQTLNNFVAYYPDYKDCTINLVLTVHFKQLIPNSSVFKQFTQQHPKYAEQARLCRLLHASVPRSDGYESIRFFTDPYGHFPQKPETKIVMDTQLFEIKKTKKLKQKKCVIC